MTAGPGPDAPGPTGTAGSPVLPGIHGALLAAMEVHAARPAQRFTGAGGGWEARTHGEVRDLVLRTAAGLRALGLSPGERVGLIADNGPLWIVADLAILAAGGVDVPRGSDSTPAEIGGILSHAGARICLCIGEEATRRVLAAPLPGESSRSGPAGGDRPRVVVRLDAGAGEAPPGVLTGEDLRARGSRAAAPASLPARGPGDIASIIYTSGTTGRPKGVTLSHGNFLHQVGVLPAVFDLRSGDVFLVMLPPWHAFERMVEYLATAMGAETVFSSPRTLREHAPLVAPTWMGSVPRVWEMMLALSGYTRLSRRDPERAAKALQESLGGRLRCAVAGGGSVAPEVDAAYNGAGIRFLVGYGLTETAPVLTMRRPEDNRVGTIGAPVPGTEIRIVDRASGAPLSGGAEGVIHARGPQVMRGYWEDPDLTAKVLLEGGWFDTGDIGALTPEGEIVFRGRVKDTIVLRGGEKVEPSRLEDRLVQSPLIEQAVVLGNDQKVLGALLVPRASALAKEIRRRADGGAPAPEAAEILREECARMLTEEAGFAVFERVAVVRVVAEPFTLENGLLTGTMKVRRAAVLARHADLATGMFGN